MQLVEPKIFVIARPEFDWDAVYEYLREVGGLAWYDRKEVEQNWYSLNPGENLVEFAGKMCYRAWEPGLNPNVTRVRTDEAVYLENILKSGHGSVLEHANYTFAMRHISRIVTHEMVRHRAGTAISQESQRYVRLDDIPVMVPEWAQDDQVLLDAIRSEVMRSEEFIKWMSDYFELDEPDTPFHEKKAKTSFMRRWAPGGVATDMTWTANVRALRHVIALRTDPSAEEEIRLVFAKIGELMSAEAPLLFGDFEVDEGGAWVPKYGKV